MSLSESIKKIFASAVYAVQPEPLIRSVLGWKKDAPYLCLKGKHHHLSNHNVYVVGFGKAVGGMCRVVQSILGDHIVAGVLSVPSSLFNDLVVQNKQDLLPVKDGKIQIYEGAANNLPDRESLLAAKKIIEICENAKENDLVITLVSGGGSALLSVPIHPLTLDEKLKVIKKLASKGATIQELNTVRKNLSAVKDGRLAEIIKPAKVWSLILSDIVGDPIDLIASGPTVPSSSTPFAALEVIEKYGLQHELASVCSLLRKFASEEAERNDTEFEHVVNVIIGNSAIAIENAKMFANSLGFVPLVLSKRLCGEAKMLGEAFAGLCELLITSRQIVPDFSLQLQHLFQNHGLTVEDAEAFSSTMSLNFDRKIVKMCFIAGGETTVTLTPNHGLGGRNQEMVLSFALRLEQLCSGPKSVDLNGVKIDFLSGGTDGQDGPTSATGAVFGSDNLESFDTKLAKRCLAEHNSNYFFNKFGGLLETGLTGTNVMDIQILLIEINFWYNSIS